MASAVYSPQCDHLRSVTAPYVFANEQAELIHVNAQLSSLDRHLPELNTLRYTLHHRSSKLHNLLSPIHAFPIEVLSYIFQLVVDSKSYSPRCDDHQDCLRQALVLSSVSSHFRCVALGTPELWKMIPLHITQSHPISDVSSLLQHCIARAQNLTICVSSGRNGFKDIETLLTFDVTRKVKAFHVYGSFGESSWISKLDRTSFPMIETLLISYISARDFDFGTLDTVTRLRIYVHPPVTLKFPIIVPPSVQYLELSKVTDKVFVPLLYQCPNLVECSADVKSKLDGPPFTKPLILNHLKRLDTGTMNAIAMSSSVQHLLLPSLEFLRLNYYVDCSLDIVPFCCSVSATLTSLTIRTHLATSDYEGLHQLCRSTFPKLRDLRFDCPFFTPLMSAIRALSPLDGECDNLRPLHLPALKSISLYSNVFIVAPRILLDSLKNWWDDEALHLHLDFHGYSPSHQKDWTPGLREELRSIVGRRQIEIIWAGDKI